MNSLPGCAISELPGPILIFGAGGFIGANLFKMLLGKREDVYGTTHSKKANQRFTLNDIPSDKIYICDITNLESIKNVLQTLQPKTILNLAAYGAYPHQQDYQKIYNTNLLGHVHILEIAKHLKLHAYIHAGSSSEYGLNCAGPQENDELMPNSHYAVSKIGAAYAIKYYGKVEQLPVAHLRLYSAYGPWEEPSRLIPTLIAYGRNNRYPPLVQPDISRDFIYIDDICSAFITCAVQMNKKMYGESFNIGTGIKTTIKDLALLVKDICGIEDDPLFGKMENRNWDTKDWFADNKKMATILGWVPKISLKKGLQMTLDWQNNKHYNQSTL